jgi:hypothetical protein
VIIDAQKMTSPDHREGSVSGALKSVIDTVEPGGRIQIEYVYNSWGKILNLTKLRTAISVVCRNHGIDYFTRTDGRGKLWFYRI